MIKYLWYYFQGLLLLLFLATLVSNTVFPRDGFLALFGQMLFTDQTVYSSQKFSDYRYFHEIEKGMSKRDVVNLIGEPFSWYDNVDKNESAGHWTTLCCGGNYRKRIVVFKGDTVEKKISEYYWD